MNVNDPSVHSVAEDLSDRSNSSNSESQLHAFQEYGKIKELNLSLNRPKDLSPNKTKDFSFNLDGSRQYGISVGSLTADRPTKDLDKPKEFDFQSEKIKDVSNYSLDRSEDTDASLDANAQNRPKDKDVIFSFDGIKEAHFPREVRDTRTKNIHFPPDKNKDFSNFQKTYNHPLDRIKEFNFGLDRRQDSQIGGVALERLRGGSFLEPADYRNPQVQPRDEFEVLAMERMRRSHILTSDIVTRNLPPHLPHPHSITEMQHSQQQQQQAKSFTIDSILGLRNNQREKPQRSQLHPYRKHQVAFESRSSRSRILDTISEHTEPSPVPSATMDQTELEAQQSQTRKLRRGRHSAPNWSSYASRLPADGTSASDCHWKTTPRTTHSVPHSHEHRRQEYGIAEPVTSCYSALNTYRPKHRASVSPLPKSSHIYASDQSYRTPGQQSVRTSRNKLLTTNNLAVVRKECYKDDVEEDDEVNEEEGNYADDNVEEEAAEEADEDQDDQPYEYNDKDYEEQEADDEVDDESDAFQAQLHRMMQHKIHKAANPRSQPVGHSEHQQELRKVHHQPHNVHKVYQDQKPSRFYPQPSETRQPIVHDTSYGDAAEVVSDDQHTPPWTPDLRRSTRRSSETNNPSWIQPRKSVDRNRDRVSSPTVTGQEQRRYHRQHQLQLQQAQLQHQHQQRHQQARKQRNGKPEIESLMMPPSSNPATKKCCLCGVSTAPYTSRKDNCRLHEYRGFTVKGPPGEDGEAEEQIVCGRCAKRYAKEDLRLGCETSSPEPGVPIYPEKSSRSRAHRGSSTYNYPEDGQTVDELLAAYASSQPRTSTLDYSSMAPRERTRHSVQTARSPMRRPSYYER